ncbi:MFS transporter [Streptomyces axinellae]|uniref:Major facilitator superfamily (MFS) profile domain-containing protein n=1 Tax=Streptomyces axinellae TaxID=552788 RepID=A0ABP6CMK2_9ACTN
MLNAYRSLLAVPHLPSLFVCSLISRLSVMALPIASTVLLSHWTGSFGEVGVLIGVQAVAQALSAPYRGRAADRGSVPRLVMVTGLSFALGLTLLIALTVFLPPGHWPLALLVAAFAGCGTSPIPQVSRAALPVLVAEEQRASIYTLEAVGQDAVATLGPLLASLTAAALNPAWSVGVCAMLALGGSVVFAAAYRRSGLAERPSRSAESERNAEPAGETGQPAAGWAAGAPPAGGASLAGGRRRPLPAEPGLLPVLVVAMCVMGAVFTINLSLVAYAGDAGSVGLSGVLVAIWTVGSLLGGLVLGATSWKVSQTVLLLGLAAGMAALALVLPPVREATPVAVIGTVLFAGGLVISPNLAANNTRVAEVAPAARRTEAFGWLQTATTGGSALSMMLSGALLDAAGPAAAIGAGTGLALIALLLPRAPRRAARAGAGPGPEAAPGISAQPD